MFCNSNPEISFAYMDVKFSMPLKAFKSKVLISLSLKILEINKTEKFFNIFQKINN